MVELSVIMVELSVIMVELSVIMMDLSVIMVNFAYFPLYAHIKIAYRCGRVVKNW